MRVVREHADGTPCPRTGKHAHPIDAVGRPLAAGCDGRPFFATVCVTCRWAVRRADEAETRRLAGLHEIACRDQLEARWAEDPAYVAGKREERYVMALYRLHCDRCNVMPGQECTAGPGDAGEVYRPNPERRYFLHRERLKFADQYVR